MRLKWFFSPPSWNARGGSYRRLPACAVLLFLFAVLGCTGRPKEPEVSGKVTVNGSPVAFGSKVTFLGEGGKQGSTTVGPDGTYTIPNAPRGSVQIVVAGNWIPVVSASAAAPAGMKASQGVPVPPKYSQPNNGLVYTVVGGKQTHNIELTP